MSRLIAIGVGLAAVAFFTLFANSIPQVKKEFGGEVLLSVKMSPVEAAAAGEEIFNNKGGCIVCHRVGAVGARAPDLAGIGGRAIGRTNVPDYAGTATNAEEYLRESLVDPCAYVVEGYLCIMPAMDQPPYNLDSLEVGAVTAYLGSLGGDIAWPPSQGELPTEATPEPVPLTAQGIADAMLCGSCHTIPGLDSATGKIGPDLSNIGVLAGETISAEGYDGEATTAREYIRESILAPDVYVVPECPTPQGGAVPCFPGVMPPTFGARLTAQQLEVLVDYLMNPEGP